MSGVLESLNTVQNELYFRVSNSYNSSVKDDTFTKVFNLKTGRLNQLYKNGSALKMHNKMYIF